MLKKGLVSFIGSDSHGYPDEHIYQRKALKRLEKITDDKELETILKINPHRALQGKSVELH